MKDFADSHAENLSKIKTYIVNFVLLRRHETIIFKPRLITFLVHLGNLLLFKRSVVAMMDSIEFNLLCVNSYPYTELDSPRTFTIVYQHHTIYNTS